MLVKVTRTNKKTGIKIVMYYPASIITLECLISMQADKYITTEVAYEG